MPEDDFDDFSENEECDYDDIEYGDREIEDSDSDHEYDENEKDFFDETENAPENDFNLPLINASPLDNWQDMAFLGAMAEEIGQERAARKQMESAQMGNDQSAYDKEIKPHASNTPTPQSKDSSIGDALGFIVVIVFLFIIIRSC